MPKELTPEQLQVIEKKYASKRIKDQYEITAQVVESITRIHVITGWIIPNDDMYMKILIEEFERLLKEDFGEMNFDEVIYAFRKNPIKDWGKSMNLQLISDVLCGYLSDRAIASESEERAKKPQQVIYTAEELDGFQRGHIEAFYQRCRNGIVPPKELPAYYKQMLVKDGYLKEGDDINEFFVFCLGKNIENIYIYAKGS